MAARGSIAVRILGKEYLIRGHADAEAVDRAAALVEQTMSKIRARTGRVDSLDVAVLAALNLANHLISARDGQDVTTAHVDADRLRGLIDLVESALASDGAATH